MGENYQVNIGARTFFCNYGAALNGGSFTELIGCDELKGGAVKNIFKTYTPFNSGKVTKILVAQEYEGVNIKSAKLLNDSPYAFESSAVRLLMDLAANETKIDLVKCIPIKPGSSYECTIYSGFFSKSNLDDIEAQNYATGEFSFEVIDRKEATGYISSGGVLSLSARS